MTENLLKYIRTVVHYDISLSLLGVCLSLFSKSKTSGPKTARNPEAYNLWYLKSLSNFASIFKGQVGKSSSNALTSLLKDVFVFHIYREHKSFHDIFYMICMSYLSGFHIYQILGSNTPADQLYGYMPRKHVISYDTFLLLATCTQASKLYLQWICLYKRCM